MALVNFRSLVALCLAAAVVVASAPAWAAPAPAALTGTVYANDVTTPLAGATVVVTDAKGVKLASRPTGADGAFLVADLAPGRVNLALETKDGAFAVGTPVTLAPGETRGVHLALKGGNSSTGGSASGGGTKNWTGGSIAAMTVVIVGFVAAGVAVNDNKSSDPASPYTPPTDK
jgi:hypothetical protein